MGRKVYLIGAGMGNPSMITLVAKEKIESSDVIIGSKRMIEGFSNLKKPMFYSCKSNEIAEYVIKHKEYKSAAVLFSGDIGFYSGANGLKSLLSGFDLEHICGISSMVYFCSKLGLAWQDVKSISLHGRRENIFNTIIKNENVFVLLGGENSVESVCNDLCKNGFGHLKVCVGEDLSYPHESIKSGTAEQLRQYKFSNLSVLLIKNDKVNFYASHSIQDSQFIRTKVPMTKSEVRSISVSKMMLNKNDIVYDIGAGTGSISIEIARFLNGGVVYAIDKNQEAIDVIRQNKEKFGAYNLELVYGEAPNVLKNLPKPSKVFIGGSQGNMKYIFKEILDKNPNAQFVINVIALESLIEVLNCIKEFGINKTEIVQISVAKAMEMGSYNIMKGQNPVFIISARRGENSV